MPFFRHFFACYYKQKATYKMVTDFLHLFVLTSLCIVTLYLWYAYLTFLNKICETHFIYIIAHKFL